MNEDSTQQLLVTRVNELILMVEPIGGQISNLEKHVNEKLDKIEEQQTEFGARHDRLEKQQAEFGVKLDSLETKVDQRLRETRPIWENVLSQLAELHKEIDGLRAETASGFRAVDRKIGVVSKNMVDMTADLQELRGVIEKLESQPA